MAKLELVGIDYVDREIRKLSPQPPLADGGGPPHDPGMEARIAKLESANEHIIRELADMKADIRELRTDAKADFRLLLTAIVSATLGLAGLMAKGFGWL